MKYEKILSIILSAFFAALLCFLGIKNKNTFFNNVKEAFTSKKNGSEFQQELNNAETKLKEKFSYKKQAVDIYGLGLMALNKNVVGNAEYMKVDSGLTMRFEDAVDTERFYNEMTELNNYLKEKDTPLIYMNIPFKELSEMEAEANGYIGYYNSLTELYNKLQDEGIDTIYLGDEIKMDESPYIKADVHLKTEFEFETAKLVCDRLMNKYGIDIPEYDKVFDKNNYTIKGYPFLGNTGRNSGRYFSGVDTFQIFHPEYDTSMDLYVYDNGEKRSGTYDEVCLNGYEQRNNINEYTYWVTDYLQYPNAYYEINNDVKGPKILFIMDSVMLRCASFLSLASSNVTVIDPRADTDIMINNALKCDYDAVVVCGISVKFFSFNKMQLYYDAADNISGLEIADMKEPVSYNGMCLEKYNGEKPKKTGEIIIDRDASEVVLGGWAVDVNVKNNLSELYLKAGDNVINCKYGGQRDSVAEYYNEPGYLNSGFTASFDASLLYDEDGERLDSISFILVGNDGTYMYEPVEYKLIWP